jgi:hypothetical protein
MTIARFHFSADLQRFLRRERRGRPFAYACAREAAIAHRLPPSRRWIFICGTWRPSR